MISQDVLKLIHGGEKTQQNKYVSLLSLLLQSFPAYFAVKTFSLLNDQSCVWSSQVNKSNKPEQHKHT